MTYRGDFLMRLSRWLLVFFLSLGQAALAQDQKNPKATADAFLITPRFNSAGHFPFTGSLINNHVNFDINIFYEKNRNGFFLFKSYDLVDPASAINYLQPGIFRRFELNRRLQLRIFAGYLFSQTAGFRDKGSDFYTAATAYWTVNTGLKVENCLLFYDLSQSQKLANRLLLSYQVKGFKLDLYLWHRWVLDSDFHSTSASLAVGLPRIKVNRKLQIQNTISYQGYLTDTKPDYAMQKGWLVSVAFPISINP